MISVSDAYVQNIYPISGRKMVAQLTFRVVNPEAQSTATAELTSENIHPNHRIDQSFGDDFELLRLATVGLNHTKLDGSFRVEPSSEEVTTGGFKVGMNFGISNATGDLIPSPLVRITLSQTQTLAGLSVQFDPDKYPRSMDIRAYRADELILSTEIRENTESYFVMDRAFDRVDRIELQIYNIGYSDASCRIGNIYLGLVNHIEESDLVNIHVIEDYGFFPETLPSSEITFDVANLDKRFNMLNPSGIYRHLMERQQIDLKFGLKLSSQTEYVCAGIYHLMGWGTGTDGTSTKFTGRSMLEFYRDKVIPLKTEACTYSELVHYIIDYLNPKQKVRIPNTFGEMQYAGVEYTKETKAVEMLQHIALATQTIIRFCRDGVLAFEGIEPYRALQPIHQYYVGDGYFMGEVNLSKIRQYDGEFIAEKDMYQYPSMQISEGVKRVSVYYDDQNYSSAEGERYGREIEVKNPLIRREEHAQQVANWLLDVYRHRLRCFIDWRNNPTIETGDIVIVQDRFHQEQPSRVVRQEFIYNGAFKGKTITVGVPYGI